MDKIDKVINYFRNLSEEAIANSVGNSGYQSGGDQSRAGLDKVMGFAKRKKYIKSPKRKPWLEFLNQKKNGRRS